MAINEFKPFAATADANVQEQADYEQSEVVKAGFRNGLARSAEVNKAIRQASSIASAVAEFTAEKSGRDMLDNGDIVSIKANFEAALSTVSSLRVAEAEGSSDALTASFDPVVKELKNGLMVHVRAKEKNLTKTPAFKADTTEARPIVKGNNLSLEEGDIAGAGHWLEMQFDGALDKWVLQNPAKGISPLSGVPVGTVEYFAMATPPAGYLKADGSEVGRETFPDLYRVIGTSYGVGDGVSTFNLPDLIDRFAQGSMSPGQKVAAGLPNITGSINNPSPADLAFSFGGEWAETSNPGALTSTTNVTNRALGENSWSGGKNLGSIVFNASRANPIYGSSDTVQPLALTLLPCIKAFDTGTNPTLIDITGLANDVNGKLDKTLNGVNVKYVTETYNDGTNWYRKWSDGWLEQGGWNGPFNKEYGLINLHRPYATVNYSVICTPTGKPYLTPATVLVDGSNDKNMTTTGFYVGGNDWVSGYVKWYAYGQGV